MRCDIIFASIVAIGLVISVTGCETAPRAGRPPEAQRVAAEPITSSTATLIVEGLSCPLCATNIDKQLMAVKGVSGVSVNLDSGRIALRLDGSRQPTGAQLERVVEDAGFTLIRIETP